MDNVVEIVRCRKNNFWLNKNNSLYEHAVISNKLQFYVNKKLRKTFEISSSEAVRFVPCYYIFYGKHTLILCTDFALNKILLINHKDIIFVEKCWLIFQEKIIETENFGFCGVQRWAPWSWKYKSQYKYSGLLADKFRESFLFFWFIFKHLPIFEFAPKIFEYHWVNRFTEFIDRQKINEYLL